MECGNLHVKMVIFLGKIRLNVVHDSVDLNLCYDQFGYEIIAF